MGGGPGWDRTNDQLIKSRLHKRKSPKSNSTWGHRCAALTIYIRIAIPKANHLAGVRLQSVQARKAKRTSHALVKSSQIGNLLFLCLVRT